MKNPMKNRIRSRFATALIGLVFVGGTLAAQDRSLSLAEFLSLVEDNSLQLENARTDRSLAEVEESLVRSQVYPSVAGQVGYTRNLTDIEQPTPAYADGNAESSAMGIYPIEYQDIDVNSDNDVSVGFSIDQKIFDMSVFRALEASRQYTTLTGTAYDATRQEILTEAKRLFFQTLLLEEVLAVRESSEEIAYDNYIETQRRLDSGLASPLELLQAEVNWKITQPDTSQARRNLNIALQNLKNFAGLDQSVDVEIDGSFDMIPALPTFGDASDVYGQRPDYRVLLNERRLRELNIHAQQATFYPSLSANLTYGWQAGSDEFDFSDPTEVWTAGLQLTVPIFFGGSRFSRVNRAQLELQKTQTQIALTEDNIATELETIRLSLEEAQLRVETARQTLDTAERAYEVSETSVENGLATQLELKDARVSRERAQLNYVAAVFDYLSAYFDWQLATGRGGEGL